MEVFLEDFVDYELSMLKNCEIKGLLPFKSIREGRGLRLIYDDGYYPILLKGGDISRFMCNRIFKVLRSLYYNLGNYLLEPQKLELSLDSLMINDEGEVAFIYLPASVEGDNFFDSLDKMIREILSHMGNDERILEAMHKLGVNGKLDKNNVDYFFELFNS